MCVILMMKDLMYARQLSNYFKFLERAAILGEPFERGGGYGSLLECVVQCPLTSGCYAVTYSFEEKTCYFYYWEKISLEVSSSMTQSTIIVNTGILSKLLNIYTFLPILLSVIFYRELFILSLFNINVPCPLWYSEVLPTYTYYWL